MRLKDYSDRLQIFTMNHKHLWDIDTDLIDAAVELPTQGQTKTKSMIEVCSNVGAGFVISYLLWLFLIPILFDIDTNAGQSLEITMIFTAAAIARSYAVRRLFNAGP